jgi:ribulose 1,5-bisphosphate synthetase/thiazole synthase
MEWITEPERRIPVMAEADLLVCGGGIAGVAAALSAARNGTKVLLIEKYGFLGGLVTASLVITVPPLNNGINLEIARRLKEKGVYVPCRHSGADTEWLNMRSIDPEITKYELGLMLHEAHVEVLLHTYVVDVIMEEREIKGVVTESKAGRHAVRAKMVVDATGDADIAAFARAPFREAKRPMTMMYNMVGVDTEKALAKIGSWSNLKKFVKQAMDRGELPFDLGIYPEYGAPGVHAEELVYPGELNVWSGMLNGMSGIDPRDLTRAEFISREHVMRLTTFLKNHIPGFEAARIEYTATQVGVRASRQIIGESSPTLNEVKTRIFDDTVVKPYARNNMRLPYGSILPQHVDNLLVAGRCISAEEEAMGQLRLWSVCTVTGQAAGTAAALALHNRTVPRKLDVSLLQKTLEQQNMRLDLTQNKMVDSASIEP